MDDTVAFGVPCHEVAFYYLMKSKGTKKLNSNSYTLGVKEYMNWLSIENLSQYTIFPTFFKDKLKNIPNYPEHIVTLEYKKQLLRLIRSSVKYNRCQQKIMMIFYQDV